MSDNETKPNSNESSPSSYGKLTDTLDGKLLDFNLKILGLFAAVLLRPLAVCTEVMFRKNLGERYFSLAICLFSALLWYVPAFFTKLGTLIDFESTNVLPNKGKVVASVIQGVFLLSAINNYRLIRQRQIAGIPWYSMSRGESIFGSESVFLNGIISFVLGSIITYFAPAFGLFFFASRIASFYLQMKEQQSIYGRYLDQMDAKILSGHLEPALIGSKTPKETLGLNCPLPKRFKGEHRAKVARVSAAVIARSLARREAEQTNQPQPKASQSNPTEDFFRTDSENRPHKVNIPDWMSVDEAKKLWDLGLKLRRFVFVGLAIATCVLAVVAAVKFVHSHKKPSVPASSVASQREQTAKANTWTMMPDGTAIQSQPQEIAPTVAPTRGILQTQNVSDRDKMIEQIKSLAVAESEKISKFKTDSESTLTSEVLDIQGAAGQYRDSLNQQNAQIQNAMSDVVKSQSHSINVILTHLENPSAIPTSNLQKVLNQLKTDLPVMEATRQEIKKSLDALNAEIHDASH